VLQVLPQQSLDQLAQQVLKEHQSMFEEVLQLLKIFHQQVMLEMMHLLLTQMVICMSGVGLNGAALVRLLDRKVRLVLLVRTLQFLAQRVHKVRLALQGQQVHLVQTQLCLAQQELQVRLVPQEQRVLQVPIQLFLAQLALKVKLVLLVQQVLIQLYQDLLVTLATLDLQDLQEHKVTQGLLVLQEHKEVA
jgi:hypothetical protein